MTLHRATRFALALGMLGLPAIARAQAFGLNEIGSCALARGFATTSAPCDDASSIYWNPGAMPRIGEQFETHRLEQLLFERLESLAPFACREDAVGRRKSVVAQHRDVAARVERCADAADLGAQRVVAHRSGLTR